jgi:DNA-binding IclR family transcriptional regulator
MKAWRAEVQSVRRDGFSIDRNNYISGIVVIAVPVFDSKQRMTHSIVGAGVADRLSDEQSSLLASELLSEARALSQLLATRR